MTEHEWIRSEMAREHADARIDAIRKKYVSGEFERKEAALRVAAVRLIFAALTVEEKR